MFRCVFKNTKIITILLLLFGISLTSAQVELQKQLDVGAPSFTYELVNVRSNQKDKSRFNLFLQISYDDLQFVKEEEKYKAEYEVTVTIKDVHGEQVDGKIWSETIIVDDYEMTNSRDKFHLTNTEFHLAPGKYEFRINVLDKDSRKTSLHKFDKEARNFDEQELAVSDITMVSHLTMDSLGIKTIRPLIATDIHETTDKLYAYFEIYSQREVEEFEVEYELRFTNGKRILKDKFKIARKDARTLYAIALDGKNISSGAYTIEIKVKDGSDSDKVEKNFVLRWRGLPRTIHDLATAIEQMKYIASASEVKKMRKAKGKDKSDLFEKFWSERDPTPGTEQNEHMEEYFRRVHYANEVFSGFREGWKSDMGMVYIILGHPNDIERHPFESGSKPYQVWYYYDINRKFVFVDETGFGEYRLLSEYWDDLFRDAGWRR